MSNRPKSRLMIILLLLLFTLLFTSIAVAQTNQSHHGAQTVASYEFLGEVTFPTGTMFRDTEVGGLSSIVYDGRTGLYYAIADDRSEINDARYYTIYIDVSDGSLDDGDIHFVRVTTILDENGQPFATGSLDPEGIALMPNGSLFISSEGSAGATPPIDPFIKRFTRGGIQNGELTVPSKYLPDGSTVGVRNNLAFESLAITPNGHYLVTATENALAQDGPATDVGQGSWSRILAYDLHSRQPAHEFVYEVGEVPEVPDPPDAFRTNGLVELLPIDNSGTLLAMERAFSVGQGNTVGIYEISIAGATDVLGYDDLYDETTGTAVPFTPVSKTLVFDVEADFGVAPDNLEGMTFGPMLPDGRHLLILVSDNNFNPANQLTQFIAVAVELAPAP
ncbi:esterase-like activity of phytase family protein [Candidatus Leptofilum sp.]|uniref:esterase-like activity of phytase family protein n=1 Tax=Candidatus Leptofilum sp. TaxID=3241576 RepID=UPI003B5B7406